MFGFVSTLPDDIAEELKKEKEAETCETVTHVSDLEPSPFPPQYQISNTKKSPKHHTNRENSRFYFLGFQNVENLIPRAFVCVFFLVVLSILGFEVFDASFTPTNVCLQNDILLIMSLAEDSPLHSSSSDDFVAILDAELKSSSSSDEESPLEQDNDGADDWNNDEFAKEEERYYLMFMD